MSERFPDWKKVYEELEVEEMGWFHPHLDPDLVRALKAKEIKSGKIWDLGCGAGNHSAELAKLGFEVVGTDLSDEGIRIANERFPDIRFEVDDILHSKMDDSFDYIFDRGCFHIFEDEGRKKYIHTALANLKKGGIFFLKCFSDANENRGIGPYLFNEEMIHQYFDESFEVEQIIHTEYQGTREVNPRALFCILCKK